MDYAKFNVSINLEVSLCRQLKGMSYIDKCLFVKTAIQNLAYSPLGHDFIRGALDLAGRPFFGYPNKPANWAASYFSFHGVVDMRDMLAAHNMPYSSTERRKCALALKEAGYAYDSVRKLWVQSEQTLEAKFLAALE